MATKKNPKENLKFQNGKLQQDILTVAKHAGGEMVKIINNLTHATGMNVARATFKSHSAVLMNFMTGI